MTSAILLLLTEIFTLGTRPPNHPSGAQPDAPVTLVVRVADGRGQFRPGEIIPIELEFSSQIPKRYEVDGATYDRSGRLTIDDFSVEPLEAVTDPMLKRLSWRISCASTMASEKCCSTALSNCARVHGVARVSHALRSSA
jgi:hypothetical protein